MDSLVVLLLLMKPIDMWFSHLPIQCPCLLAASVSATARHELCLPEPFLPSNMLVPNRQNMLNFTLAWARVPGLVRSPPVQHSSFDIPFAAYHILMVLSISWSLILRRKSFQREMRPTYLCSQPLVRHWAQAEKVWGVKEKKSGWRQEGYCFGSQNLAFLD